MELPPSKAKRPTMLPGSLRNRRGRFIGAGSGARVSGQARTRGFPGHPTGRPPARSAPWRAPEPRLRLSGTEFAARERRSSKDARKARPTRMSPCGQVYLTTFGKLASARRIKAEFGQFRCLPLHPTVPEARFSLRTQSLRPEDSNRLCGRRLRTASPRLVSRPSANRDRAKPVAQRAPRARPR